jgi:hypothetical protein
MLITGISELVVVGGQLLQALYSNGAEVSGESCVLCQHVCAVGHEAVNERLSPHRAVVLHAPPPGYNMATAEVHAPENAKKTDLSRVKKNSSYLRSSAPQCEAGRLTLLEKEDREWSDQDPGDLRQPPTRNGKRKCPHHKEQLLSVSPAHLLASLDS